MCELIEQVNNVLWGYVLIAALVTCGLWFTWKTRFAQFRMIGEMLRLLTDSATSGTSGLQDKHVGHRHISSFQAFAVSVATRVGTGNLAGVATAIAIGGPAYYIEKGLHKRWMAYLFAIVILGKYTFRLLDDYRAQKRRDIKEPTFYHSQFPEIQEELECWD